MAKTIEYCEVHSFRCSCGELVALRFTKMTEESMYWYEFWHGNKLYRTDGAASHNLQVVGKNLRVMLQDTHCQAAEWFTTMGYDND